MHRIFFMPSYQDLLVQYPPVSRKDLIRLAEELLYTFLILPLDLDDLATLRTMQEYISNAMSISGTSPPSLSSAETTVLAERFHQVPFHH
jgi:hypothetical protein